MSNRLAIAEVIILTVKAYKKDVAGNFGMMAAIVFLVLIISAGGTLDIMRAQADLAYGQDVADIAVLAAAQSLKKNYNVANSLSSADLLESENFSNSPEKENIKSKTIMKRSGETYTFTTRVEGETNNFFLGMIGRPKTKWVAIAKSEATIPRREVILVLDVSWSMRGQPLDELKKAATRFVEEINPHRNGASYISVSIIPFAESINFGQEHEPWLDSRRFNGTTMGLLHSDEFNGCFRRGGNDFPGRLQAAVQGDVAGIPYCPPDSSKVMLFGTDGETLKKHIEGMEIGFGTATDYALQWARYAVHNVFRPKFIATEARPIRIRRNITDVDVILLTDGEISHTDTNQNGIHDDKEGLRQERKDYEKVALEKFRKTCQIFKDIDNNWGRHNLYTIGYTHDIMLSPEMEKALSECISGEGRYFQANEGDLSETFKSIASNLSPIRLTR